MVNLGYFGKEKEIFQVLNREGVVTLFDFLDKKEWTRFNQEIAQRKKTIVVRKVDVLKGIYSEEPCSFEDAFLWKMINLKMNKMKKGNREETLTEKSGRKISWKLLEFHHGDYILRNDQALLSEEIYAVYSSQQWDDASGGYVVFVDRGGNHIRVPSLKNSLTLVKNPSSFYVKYVNHLAKGKRMFLLGMSNRLE